MVIRNLDNFLWFVPLVPHMFELTPKGFVNFWVTLMLVHASSRKMCLYGYSTHHLKSQNKQQDFSKITGTELRERLW